MFVRLVMRLSSTSAFYLQASIILFFLAGSSAPTPLYALYQAQWGFSPITVTVIFGIYALAVLAALLTVGSLSDYIGRRPVLFVATLLQAAAMWVFARAHGVNELIVARIMQGIATGGAASAIGRGCWTSIAPRAPSPTPSGRCWARPRAASPRGCSCSTYRRRPCSCTPCSAPSSWRRRWVCC